MYYNNKWGTVCSGAWDVNDAKVVCRQLGFPVEGARAYGDSRFEGSILLDDIRCYGSESALSQCLHAGWGVNNCSHQKAAGVACGKCKEI